MLQNHTPPKTCVDCDRPTDLIPVTLWWQDRSDDTTDRQYERIDPVYVCDDCADRARMGSLRNVRIARVLGLTGLTLGFLVVTGLIYLAAELDKLERSGPFGFTTLIALCMIAYVPLLYFCARRTVMDPHRAIEAHARKCFRERFPELRHFYAPVRAMDRLDLRDVLETDWEREHVVQRR